MIHMETYTSKTRTHHKKDSNNLVSSKHGLHSHKAVKFIHWL